MQHRTTLRRRLVTGVAAAAIGVLGLAACSAPAEETASGDDILIGLITKTDSNPFFVAMSEAAQEAAAGHDGVEVQTFAGSSQTDAQSQVDAVETLIARGADAIMIVAIDPGSIEASLQRAKDEGILVIALDTPLDVADATIATDNFVAGEAIGEWARAKFEAEGTYDDAKVAMLDLSANQVSVDILRNQGFMSGFGFDIADPDVIGDESDARIVGHEISDGNEEGGRLGMELLLQRDPEINLVYAMSEYPARGAYQAILAAGLEDQITIVAIDGECAAVPEVEAGIFGADSMQFPSRMASMGVDAVVSFVRDGVELEPSIDSGVGLYSTEAFEGLEVNDIAWAEENCWG